MFNELKQRYDNAVNGIAGKYFEEAYVKRLKFEKVCSLLSDEESRNLYVSEIARCLLKCFLSGDNASVWTGLMSNAEWARHLQQAADPELLWLLKSFTYPPKERAMMHYFIATTFILEQYRYKDIVDVSKGDICIDCGACLGDTTLWMVKSGAKEVHSFEIDKENIECLQKTISSNSVDRKVKIVQKAVSSREGGVIYYSKNQGNVGGGTVSFEEKEGSYPVEVCRLDDYCKEAKVIPDFIKMDIEGAEMSALNGAREVIAKHAPKLAICIYHSWEDRFNIPLLINEINPSYRMYLKKSHPSAETVLLCTV